MSLKISRSPLDSERFGVAVARAWFPTSAGDVAQIGAFCEQEKMDLCIVRVNNECPDALGALQANHFFIADSTLTLTLDISQMNPHVNASEKPFRAASTDDSPALIEIARRAFQNYHSHYANDPRLDPRQSAEVYPDWIRRAAAASGPDSTVLIAERQNTVAGFIALLHESPRSIIDLVAVHPNFQHQGCLGSMLAASAAWARTHGDSLLSIATQLDNTAVQTACAHAGFKPGPVQHTLHGWLAS